VCSCYVSVDFLLFQSTRSERSATLPLLVLALGLLISIHALRAERDFNCQCLRVSQLFISIHALRAERDQYVHNVKHYDRGFQSTRSERSATVWLVRPVEFPLISIHALRAERDYIRTGEQQHLMISIHALRAERDQPHVPNPCALTFISIHALRAERDCSPGNCTRSCFHFNPRAPSGARQNFLNSKLIPQIISIHALRAERDATRFTQNAPQAVISIHALRAERDPPRGRVMAPRRGFQSTRSERSAT